MDIKKREQKIQEKRKNTPWRDYIKEIASWFTINVHKNEWLISRYPKNDRILKIIPLKDYNQLWNQEFSLSYDFSKNFWEQFIILRNNFKHPNILNFDNNENSDFADVVFGVKNAYLAFTVWQNSENILYSAIVYTNCTNVINSTLIFDNSQNIYFSKSISKWFNIFYSKYINDSSNIWFSSNMIGCQECIRCNDLINQSYSIDNISYPKEEYLIRKNEILSKKSSFNIFLTEVDNIAKNYDSKNCIWVGIKYSKNINNWYYVERASNWNNMTFVSWINHANNYYDVFEAWVNSDDFYAVSNAWTDSNNIYCSTQIEKSSNLFHCYHMENCSYCLGCIGLKNKSFCILNKQYTKEERFELANKIFEQMDIDWTLWQFFPWWMNPFYFNDTAAYLIDDSFTKEEVTKEGYLRRDEEIKVDIPEWAEIVYSHKVEGQKSIEDFQWFDSDWNRKINPEILKKVIQDEKWNYYRIVPMELEFLQKHGLPLPEIHWLERIKLGFKFK
jgi:hypothetical protein